MLPCLSVRFTYTGYVSVLAKAGPARLTYDVLSYTTM